MYTTYVARRSEMSSNPLDDAASTMIKDIVFFAVVLDYFWLR